MPLVHCLFISLLIYVICLSKKNACFSVDQSKVLKFLVEGLLRFVLGECILGKQMMVGMYILSPSSIFFIGFYARR